MASMPVNPNPPKALLLCGNGADLGDFKVLANSLAHNELSKSFEKDNIVIKSTVLRDEVFEAILDQPDGSIQELHVFSHSIGGGLYVGYHHPTSGTARSNMFNSIQASGRKITYMEVLQAEIGGILTDHLIVSPFNKDQKRMKAKFTSNATAKFWGCNAGVSGWTYTDGDNSLFYWRALNTQNTPKPSIAQAFADFWGIEVSGASSGAHIEVFLQKHWITSNQYKSEKKHWPGSGEVLRLTPDKGAYIPYAPTK